MFDFNDASPQMAPAGDLIPDGTFAKVKMTIRPGGTNGSGPMDAGLLKQSASSDAKMLDCEMTVMIGPFARRKFWQNFTVAGGKLDEKGQSKGWNISKSAFRAMIDSALGLDPKDMTEGAKAKRTILGLKQLDGIEFAARIMIEPATEAKYKDQNKIANIVQPGDVHYGAIMSGQAVEPEPVNAKPRVAAKPDAAGFSFAGGAAQPGFAAAAPKPTTAAPAWLNG